MSTTRRGFFGSLLAAVAAGVLFKRTAPRVITVKRSRKVFSGGMRGGGKGEAYVDYMNRELPKLTARLQQQIDAQLYGDGHLAHTQAHRNFLFRTGRQWPVTSSTTPRVTFAEWDRRVSA